MKKHATGILLCLFLIASPTFAQDETWPAASDAAGTHSAGSKNEKRFLVPFTLPGGGAANNPQFTFDTTIFMTYTPGLAGLGAGPGATVDVYLLAHTAVSLLRTTAGQDVCNPCTFALGPDRREESVRIRRLITAGDFPDAGMRPGLLMIVVRGADPDGVNLQGSVVTSHAGASQQSFFTFEPQPIAAEAQ